MKITLSPIVAKAVLTLERNGDTLTINGEALDFSPLGNGGTIPAGATGNEHIIAPVERDDAGVLHLTVRFPIGHFAGTDARYPEPIHVTEDGPISLPDPGHEPKESSA